MRPYHGMLFAAVTAGELVTQKVCGGFMKKTFVLTFICMMIAGTLWAEPCLSQDYDTQKGAVLGAIGGALAGQAIGHNTAGTLLGAAGGALVGAIAGNAVEQAGTQTRLAQAEPPPAPKDMAHRLQDRPLLPDMAHRLQDRPLLPDMAHRLGTGPFS